MVDLIEQQTTDNADLRPYPSLAGNLHDSNDQWQEFDVDFKRTSRSRFGFSITGGNKDSPAISIDSIEKGGVADGDGRLKLHDIILHVNNISFKDINHEKAVRELRSAGKHIRMRIRRSVPGISEELPLCTQNNSPKLSIVGSMLDGIGNNDIITLTKNMTPSNVDAHQPQQLPDDVPCVNGKPMNQPRHSESRSNTNNKPVKEYEVGTYENLKCRSLRRDDLVIHHLIQPDIALALIPEYKESEAICIALHKSKYDPLLTISENQINSLFSNYNPKKTLAYAIGCNAKPRTIPTPVLLEAIQLHCQKFPRIYEKTNLDTLRQDSTTINCNANELIPRIPFMDPSFVGKIEDIMKYGNCVKDLRVKIRRFLEETGESEACSWENTDLSGKYVLHKDTDPLTGRPRFLIIRIQLDHSETHEEESDDYIKTITTYYHKIALIYK